MQTVLCDNNQRSQQHGPIFLCYLYSCFIGMRSDLPSEDNGLPCLNSAIANVQMLVYAYELFCKNTICMVRRVPAITLKYCEQDEMLVTYFA